jgi:hypothetical protein
MAKRKKRSQSRRQAEQKPVPSLNEPWLGKRTGLIIMIVFTVAFAAFITWQLAPTEGTGRAILWGLGFGAGTWAVFGLALAFNTWIRRR